MNPYAIALRVMMSDISEEAYCATWMHDNEYVLWGMVQGDIDPYYGMYAVSREEIATLKTLSEDAGVWFIWDANSTDNEAQPISLDDWSPRYEAWLDARPALVTVHSPD